MAREPGLLEFMSMYPDEDACWHALKQARWGDGFQCPRCGETEHYGFVKTRALFQCHECGHQTSVTAGTTLQDTKLPLRTWFIAAYFVCTTKKGVSTPDLARKLGISERSVWFVNHKILHVLGKDQAKKLFGIIEVDETTLEGNRGKSGRGKSEQLVVGLVERRDGRLGRVRLVHVNNPSRPELHGAIHDHIKQGSTVRTDGWQPYRALEGYDHERLVDRPDAIPGSQLPSIHLVFSNLRRVVKGVHTRTSDERLQPYLDAFAYRFEHRDNLVHGAQHAFTLLARTQPLTYAQIAAGGLN